MSTVVYPECLHDDIRKSEINLTNPLSNNKIKRGEKPKSNIFVCLTCCKGKVIIAKGNRFDFIDAIY